jgi:hypothetical protein
MSNHLRFRSVIASRCVCVISRQTTRIIAASLSSVPLKGSYTAITEQLWWQREEAKRRCTSPAARAGDHPVAPKPQHEAVVEYDFPGDAKLKDEYSNPWGDARRGFMWHVEDHCSMFCAVCAAPSDGQAGLVSFLRIWMLWPEMSLSPTAMMETQTLPRHYSSLPALIALCCTSA